MRRKAEVRRAARRLLRLGLLEGRLDPARVREVVRRYREAHPRDLLPVLGELRRLVRLEVARRAVLVETAAELDTHVRGAIRGAIERRYGAGLTGRFQVNPSLIGGVRIRVGNDIWDGSVRGRLETLRRQWSASETGEHGS